MTVARNGPDQPLMSELLHEVNRHIRDTAAHFASSAGDDLPQEYICECGCGQWLSLSGSEFDGRIAAERPVTARGHVVARVRGARRALRGEAAVLGAELRETSRVNGA